MVGRLDPPSNSLPAWEGEPERDPSPDPSASLGKSVVGIEGGS